MHIEVLSESNFSYVLGFDCGDVGINNYINEEAMKDQDANQCTTTLVFNSPHRNKKLIGFYTLKNTSLLFKPDNKLRGYPAIEIVYIAVDISMQRKKYGSQILRKIIYKSLEYSESFSAVQVLILSSLKSCVNFYKKNSFRDFTNVLGMIYDDCRDTTVPLFINLAINS